MNKRKQSFSCRGLQPLKEGDKLYGRDVEIKELSNRIQENLHTILYGQSGAGKSSVIEAGVFPVLRKNNYFPVVIRFLEVETTNYMEYVISQVRAVALSRNDFKESYKIVSQVEVSEADVSELLAFLQGNIFVDDKGEQYTPLLVFDQFEEVLNNPDTYESGERFIKDIYPLIDDSYCLNEGYLPYSNYRVLFSIREDFLYALEDIVDKHRLAELRQNRIRMRFLDTDSAVSVVSRILVDNVTETNADSEDVERLARMIVTESKNTSYSFGVSTPTLSMICYQLIKNGLRIKDIDKTTIVHLIYNFYADAVADVSYKCRNYLEDRLITKDGRRASVDVKDAEAGGNISTDEIDKLVNKTRLLSIINIGKTKRLEFSHDIIVRIINKNRRGFFQSLKNVLKNPFQFAGYASKEEFFAYGSFCVVVWFGLSLLYNWIPWESHVILFKYNYQVLLLINIIQFLAILPLVSVSVRRLHSIGRSGWWILVPFVPLFWASRPDSVIPYQGGLSNVRIFDLLLDWKTPPIRKSCGRNVYIARHLYSIYIYVISVCLITYFLALFSPQDLNQAYEDTNWTIYAYIAVFANNINCIFLVLSCSFYAIYFTKTMLLAMRLPRMGFRRFWAFMPIISWIFWVYGFWPDTHFDKRRFKKRNTSVVQ